MAIAVAIIVTDEREIFRRYSDPSPSFGSAQGALLEGLSKLPNHEFHTISCAQQPLTSPPKILGNIHHHTLVVPKLGWLRTGYSGCLYAIRKLLRQIKPAVVHGQGTERYCALAALHSGYPNAVTIHGNMTEVARILHARFGGYFWLTAKLQNYVLPRTGGIFCNSEYTESMVRPLNPRTWRVPNALRTEFFSPPPLRTAIQKPILLNIGTIIEYKQQLELLELCGQLHRKGCRFQMQFIGPMAMSGDYGARFQARMQTAEKEGYAKYLGEKDLCDLKAYMDVASALVHTPTEETFGLVVAESLARNLKFFGFKTGGVPEIAHGVDSAELFAPQDWEGIGASIADWLVSGCPAPLTAHAEMKSRYHPDVIAAKHLEVYRQLMSK